MKTTETVREGCAEKGNEAICYNSLKEILQNLTSVLKCLQMLYITQLQLKLSSRKGHCFIVTISKKDKRPSGCNKQILKTLSPYNHKLVDKDCYC